MAMKVEFKRKGDNMAELVKIFKGDEAWRNLSMQMKSRGFRIVSIDKHFIDRGLRMFLGLEFALEEDLAMLPPALLKEIAIFQGMFLKLMEHGYC